MLFFCVPPSDVTYPYVTEIHIKVLEFHLDEKHLKAYAWRSHFIVPPPQTMGSSASRENTKPSLATAAVANYMRLTKAHVRLLLRACRRLAQTTPPPLNCIRRRDLPIILDQATLLSSKEREIVTLLATLWDYNGTGKIPYHEFVLGLTPLACPHEDMEDVLELAVELMSTDENHSLKTVSAKQTVVLLKSK